MATTRTGPSHPVSLRCRAPCTKPARGPPPAGFSTLQARSLAPIPTSTARTVTDVRTSAVLRASVDEDVPLTDATGSVALSVPIRRLEPPVRSIPAHRTHLLLPAWRLGQPRKLPGRSTRKSSRCPARETEGAQRGRLYVCRRFSTS